MNQTEDLKPNRYFSHEFCHAIAFMINKCNINTKISSLSGKETMKQMIQNNKNNKI